MLMDATSQPTLGLKTGNLFLLASMRLTSLIIISILMSRCVLSHPQVPHLIGGDFNATLVVILDKSTHKLGPRQPDSLSKNHLASVIESLSLTDVWRYAHPTDRE